MAKEAFMSYDPWSNIQSRNGIPGDELISMLQKVYSTRTGGKCSGCGLRDVHHQPSVPRKDVAAAAGHLR